MAAPSDLWLTRLLALRVRRRSRAPAAVQPLRAALAPGAASGRRSPWIPPGSCLRPSSSSVSCGIWLASASFHLFLLVVWQPSWAPPRNAKPQGRERCRGRRERMPRPGRPWTPGAPAEAAGGAPARPPAGSSGEFSRQGPARGAPRVHAVNLQDLLHRRDAGHHCQLFPVFQVG